MARLIATIAPPTPNGDLHLGHLAGPFLAADVFTRARRLLGDDVVLLSYSDDYQSYADRKARELGEDRFAMARRFADRIADTMAQAQIGIDQFPRAFESPYYGYAVAFFFGAAAARGAIGRRPFFVPYCKSCELYGYEAFARGGCDHCGAPSDPSQCEACAHAPDASSMTGLECTQCGAATAWRSIECDYLRLDRYRGFLRELYASQRVRPRLAGFIDEVLARPELAWPVDRPLECGIEIEAGKPFHTWFGGLAGYYAAFQEYAARVGRPDLVESYWRCPDTRIFHFLGFDCSFSHGVVYPSLLSNVEGMTTRVKVVPNAFLKLEGGDFSTSRGHAIWVSDVLREYSSDCLRLHLARIAPEDGPTSFEMERFRSFARDQHDAGLLAALAAARAETEVAQTPAAAELAALNALRGRWWRAADFEDFSMCALAEVVLELLDTAVSRRRAGAPATPWLAAYAALAEPLQPALAAEIIDELHLDPVPLRAWLRGEVEAPRCVRRDLEVARSASDLPVAS